MKTSYLISFVTGLALLNSGCRDAVPRAEAAAGSNASQRGKLLATATLGAASGSDVRGAINFYQSGDTVRVEAQVTGLTPGEHGFHIHEKGDCSAPDASSAGGHFNPDGMPHGGPGEHRRHVGDFGNLQADANGIARYTGSFTNLAFEGARSVVGKAVIIHAQPDDLKTQPTGNAGGRVACGVINKVPAR